MGELESRVTNAVTEIDRALTWLNIAPEDNANAIQLLGEIRSSFELVPSLPKDMQVIRYNECVKRLDAASQELMQKERFN